MKNLYITQIGMKLFEVPQNWIKLSEVTQNLIKMFNLAQIWMELARVDFLSVGIYPNFSNLWKHF